MPVAKINRRFVTALESVVKPTIYYDSEIKGFGLKVQPSGAKSWIVEYRPGTGGRRVAKKRMVIGSPTTMPPEQARSAAAKILAGVSLGGDPASDKAKDRAANTLRELAEAYLTRHVRTKRKASTEAYYKQVLESHILPALGSKNALQVTRADVARLHSDIVAKRRCRRKDGAGQPPAQAAKAVANRALAIISAVYGWGDGAGLVPDGTNPARKVEKYEERSRERFLSSDEMNRLGAALHLAETFGLPTATDPQNPKSKHAPKTAPKMGLHAVAAIRLLMLTGARLREILHLEWTHVDIERGVLFLPDSKTGKKAIVLSTPALAILRTLPRMGRFVIAGESVGLKGEQPRSDLKRPWAQITKHAKLDGLRIHDLRHTFASIGAGKGLGLPMIGGLLGHADARTTSRYAHLAVDPVRAAADLIAGQIADSLAGAKT